MHHSRVCWHMQQCSLLYSHQRFAAAPNQTFIEINKLQCAARIYPRNVCKQSARSHKRISKYNFPHSQMRCFDSISCIRSARVPKFIWTFISQQFLTSKDPFTICFGYETLILKHTHTHSHGNGTHARCFPIHKSVYLPLYNPPSHRIFYTSAHTKWFLK